MEFEVQEHEQNIQGIMLAMPNDAGKKFDIKTILMRLVPTLVGLVTELVMTGKINTKGKDSVVLQGIVALLHGLLDELEAVDSL